MTHNYECEDAIDKTRVTVTIDPRLKQVRIVRPEQPIEFLNILDEYDGRMG